MTVEALLGLDPALVGIELGYRGSDFGGVLTEVLLVDHSILIHDKGHHARVAVFGRIGHERKAARELAIQEIVFGATFGRWALLGQDAVIVAVKWGLLAWLQVVGSSRQGCESGEVEVLVPSIACIRMASMSDACGGNDACSARM